MATNERLMRGGYNNAQGLRELTRLFPRDSVGVEVGSFKGESAQIFMDSGHVRKLVCVDYWPYGEWLEAEKDFERNVKRFGDRVIKIKGESVKVARQFKTQSFDWLYIDANHNYPDVVEDIAAWRLKVKAGGLIAGHDFHLTNFPGVVQAVTEAFKTPFATFQDHSWVVKLPTNNFEIVTYVSGGYEKCLAITLPTWLEHSKADRIVIYTDSPEMERAVGVDPRVEWRHHFQTKSDSMAACWERKIEILTDAYQRCPARFFCWLDADVLATCGFKEAFFKMGNADIGGTRMFNTSKRGRGELNAGVIFFRHGPALEAFFNDWLALSNDFKAIGKGGIWFEQASASRLIHEAFHGQHKYSASALSENVYNLEDDETANWFARIEKYRPKLIHLKQGRWKVPGYLEKLKVIGPSIKVHYESKGNV